MRALLFNDSGIDHIGPVLTGLLRLDRGQKRNWELGVIFGSDSKTPNTDWKLNVGYEFN